ncbi:hypothetical protein PGQ11_010181 [Apiospora arundinis]|uniref:Uncharacterized protein n=1 Tax=Apiospora arundinis TaxID=335852 RepID=A0ABR2I9G2_9PEZI
MATCSCLLENCLIPSSRLGCLPEPLTGIVFHYDTFVSDTGGTPYEAAYLANYPRVKVRVLCASTNIPVIKDIYSKVGNVTVEELRLDESDLYTKRMLDIMVFRDKAQQPLYMSVIQRILRIEQQTTRSRFKYAFFANKLDKESLTPDQRRPLNQRLDTLESFLVQARPSWEPRTSRKALVGKDWSPQPGGLLIVDLSYPCVTPTMACSLFNICLSVFLEQQNVSSQTQIGRIIALDEAHIYMGETAECVSLTNNLLSTIRLQRHLGVRIFISTQEPTISPKLLDLCSVTVVRRFNSPDWLRVLSDHLAGISSAAKVAKILEGMEQHQIDSNLLGGGGKEQDTNSGIRGMALSSEVPVLELFSRIVKIGTGEALVFSPSSIVGLEKDVGQGGIRRHRRLAHNVLQVVVRARITEDGGRSIMAA